MIIISAVLEFGSEAERDAAARGSADLQRATREEEPGCLAYCFGIDPVEPTRIQVFEQWEDAAALDAHFVHPNYTNMRTFLHGAGLVQSSAEKYRIDAVAPVYNADRKATAEF